MVILLLAKDEVTSEQVTEDRKSLQKAMNVCTEHMKNTGKAPPMIVTLHGYEAYVVPGTIEAVEETESEDGTNRIIKLDFQYMFDVAAEGA